MTELVWQFIIPIVIVLCVVGSVGVVTLIVVLRDKISGVHVSRTGVEVRTNDIPVWSQVVDTIERIDSDTRKTVRKGTTRLMILGLHETSADAMVVNRDAVFQLVCATYDNHHTREIAADDGDIYLACKAHDVFTAVRVGRKHFPELTYERAEVFVCYWFKRILLPALLRACKEKVAYYSSQIDGNEVSNSIKMILQRCRKKNVDYITLFDELVRRSDLEEKSGILLQEQNLNPT
jgi:hypothetical protein